MTEQNITAEAAENDQTMDALAGGLNSLQEQAQGMMDLVPLGAFAADLDPETAGRVAQAATQKAASYMVSDDVVELLTGLTDDETLKKKIHLALVTLQFTVSCEVLLAVNEMFSERAKSSEKSETH